MTRRQMQMGSVEHIAEAMAGLWVDARAYRSAGVFFIVVDTAHDFVRVRIGPMGMLTAEACGPSFDGIQTREGAAAVAGLFYDLSRISKDAPQ